MYYIMLKTVKRLNNESYYQYYLLEDNKLYSTDSLEELEKTINSLLLHYKIDDILPIKTIPVDLDIKLNNNEEEEETCKCELNIASNEDINSLFE